MSRTRTFGTVLFVAVVAAAGCVDLPGWSESAAPPRSPESAAVPRPPESASSDEPALKAAPSDPVPSTSPDATATFVRKVDVGPQADTYGHTPAGALKRWPHSNTITDEVFPRDPDGWMRIRGFRFSGPVRIKTANVAFSDCEFTPGADPRALHNGLIWSSTTMPSGGLLIDHCRIDQGMTGLSAGGVKVYQPIKTTVRYSLFEGSGDGIKANSNGLYEHNYIQVNGQGTVVSPGHVDGIQGEYFKYNWTARHNTIIGGVGRTRPEAGGNIGIWAPRTATGSIGPSGSEGVVVEDNYIDGFNIGVGMQGTNPDNPHTVRRNTFGTDFRYYPNYRVRTWSEYPHVQVDNNVYDHIFDDATGTTSPA